MVVAAAVADPDAKQDAVPTNAVSKSVGSSSLLQNSPPDDDDSVTQTSLGTWGLKRISFANLDGGGSKRQLNVDRSGKSSIHGGLATTGTSFRSNVSKPWYRIETDKARRHVTRLFQQSQLEDCSQVFPRFTQDECSLGKFLGKGAFGTVHEIREFDVELQSGAAGNDDKSKVKQIYDYEIEDDDDDDDDDIMEGRDFIAQHCTRATGESRYAIKCLSTEIIEDRSLYCQGVANMAIEARILGAIEHPNIIKLRATAACDMYQQPGFFLIMDRLYDTLDRRLIKWQRRHRRPSSFLSIFNRKSKQKSALSEERLVAAFDLSAALQYLHSKKILHRDLKPDNIGFDIRDDIKLFDFSLATELHSKVADKDGTYNLTGMTGSLRYMAPEVALEKPYNETCDVYSFAILFWEIYALMTPFALLTSSVFMKYVFERDTRPNITESWPQPIKVMLKRCWSKEIGERLSMQDITSILKKEITHIRGGDDRGLEHTRRRSTFVFRKPADARQAGL